MKPRPMLAGLAASATLFVALAATVPAGDLNPPAAPAPTMVPLDQINATASAAATNAANAATAATNAESAANTAAANASTAATNAAGAQSAANTAATNASTAATNASNAATAASGAQTAANAAATNASNAATAASGAQSAANSAATNAMTAATNASNAASAASAAATNASNAETAANTAAANAASAATAASDAMNRAALAETAANNARDEAIRAQDGRVPIDTLPGSAAAIRVISAPGSYYLRQDLQGSGGMHGILVNSSNVTIDLNGFEIVGSLPFSLNGIGISVASIHDVTIKNGRIRDWGGDAIGCVGPTLVRGCRIEDIAVNACNSGFRRLSESTLARCSAKGCVGTAFDILDSELVDCVARSNSFVGFSGSGNFLRCKAISNASDGFQITGAGTLSECASELNVGNGFTLGGIANRLLDSVARSNTLYGVDSTNAAAEIARCHVAFNAGGAGSQGGIRSSGQSSTIDGNRVADNNDFGISVSGADALVIRNWVRGGNPASNYVLSAGVKSAQVISTTTGFASTDPWANLSN